MNGRTNHVGQGVEIVGNPKITIAGHHIGKSGIDLNRKEVDRKVKKSEVEVSPKNVGLTIEKRYQKTTEKGNYRSLEIMNQRVEKRVKNLDPGRDVQTEKKELDLNLVNIGQRAKNEDQDQKNAT